MEGGGYTLHTMDENGIRELSSFMLEILFYFMYSMSQKPRALSKSNSFAFKFLDLLTFRTFLDSIVILLIKQQI